MAEETQDPRPLAQPVTESNWKLRIVLVVTLVVVLGLGYLFGTTVVPRWWAHRVGNRVDGSLTAGTLYGLFIGFVFTFVPLVIARQVFRRVPNKVRLAFLVIAIVAAAPNLMTLSIVTGSSNAAHAGDRVLDVEGPGFRAGSAWGVAIAVVVAVGLFVWTWQWRRDRRQLKGLKAERRAAASAAKEPEESADE